MDSTQAVDLHFFITQIPLSTWHTIKRPFRGGIIKFEHYLEKTNKTKWVEVVGLLSLARECCDIGKMIIGPCPSPRKGWLLIMGEHFEVA